MTYQDALKYLESFINYERFPAWPYRKSLNLERIKNFLKVLGNPQDCYRSFHVAGSKGKGSTCVFIAYILRQAGFKVGLYTSPHLCDFRERIRVLLPRMNNLGIAMPFEGKIQRRELADIVTGLRPVIKRYNANSKFGALTYFEVITAAAYVYFKKRKVDFAVLETGLGGRLDATNIVRPLASVITPISYEHTDKLGKTIDKIAREKSGIIKDGVPVISAPQKKEAFKVIRKRCKIKNVKLSIPKPGVLAQYGRINLPLLGRHQKVNAAVAVSAVKVLSDYGISIKDSVVRQGINHTLWPGRCEVLSRNPFVVLDGAQNAASAAALKSAIKDNFKYKNLTLVLGVSSDKDIPGICRELYPIADKVILTRADTPRAMQPESLANGFLGKEVYLTDNVKDAKLLARKLSSARDIILVTGSLFVVGEYRDD